MALMKNRQEIMQQKKEHTQQWLEVCCYVSQMLKKSITLLFSKNPLWTKKILQTTDQSSICQLYPKSLSVLFSISVQHMP